MAVFPLLRRAGAGDYVLRYQAAGETQAQPGELQLNSGRFKKSGKPTRLSQSSPQRHNSTASQMAMRTQRKPTRHFRQKPDEKRITEHSPE